MEEAGAGATAAELQQPLTAQRPRHSSLQDLTHQRGAPTRCKMHTGEQSLLCASITNARPPALVYLLDLFDQLPLHQVHFIILLRLDENSNVILPHAENIADQPRIQTAQWRKDPGLEHARAVAELALAPAPAPARRSAGFRQHYCTLRECSHFARFPQIMYLKSHHIWMINSSLNAHNSQLSEYTFTHVETICSDIVIGKILIQQ